MKLQKIIATFDVSEPQDFNNPKDDVITKEYLFTLSDQDVKTLLSVLTGYKPSDNANKHTWDILDELKRAMSFVITF